MHFSHTSYSMTNTSYAHWDVPDAVEAELQRGNFYVKRPDVPFGHVWPGMIDLAEHVESVNEAKLRNSFLWIQHSKLG